MSFFSNVTNSESLANEKDVLGGGGSYLLDTGVYLCKVTMAYGSESVGGAKAVNLTFKTEEGKEIRQTVYITSGAAKGTKTFYLDKDGAERPLPGYSLVNSLSLLTTGKEILELEAEDKMVNVYSVEARAEVPTKVPVFVDLLGQEVYLAVNKILENKREKDMAGNYVPVADTRELNEISKVFRASDKRTVHEIESSKEATFMDAWSEKWSGVLVDKTKPAGSLAPSSASRANGSPTATQKPKQSLFGATA